MRYKAVIHTGFPSTLKHEADARAKGAALHPQNEFMRKFRGAWIKATKGPRSGRARALTSGASELYWPRETNRLEDAELARLKGGNA